MVALSCYDSPIRRKEGDRLWVSFAGKCDRNADMWLTYLLDIFRTKDIFWQRIEYGRNINRRATESD
jgi:hypothetical protein